MGKHVSVYSSYNSGLSNHLLCIRYWHLFQIFERLSVGFKDNHLRGEISHEEAQKLGSAVYFFGSFY